jgi:phage repressor protein C with HTH and peptisase S24 domain
MSKTNNVTTRIAEMIAHYGLNANSLTVKLGYSTNSKMYKILSGTEPSFPTLVDMLRAFPEVSPNWLVLGEGSMLRAPTNDAATNQIALARGRRPPVINSGQVLTITVDSAGNENTELVPVQAQAGYSVQHNEAVYLQDLPRYRIPGFEHGTYRAFEVAGDSMEPTLNHRDVVVASYVDNWRLLEPGDVYVVVTAESVMLKRIRERITAHDMTVMLYSDNHHRKPYPMDCTDIAQLWRVRGYISTYLPSAPDVTVERLWEVIEVLGFDKGEVRRHLEENASTETIR